MKALNVLSLGAVVCIGALAACGGEPTGHQAQLAGSTMMQAALQEFPLEALLEDGTPSTDPNSADPNAAACHEINVRLHKGREALAATPEWKALTETPEWAAIEADVHAAKEAGCKCNDANPSAACVSIVAQLKADATALQATSAYTTAEATTEWQTLAQAYADAKANDCWSHHHNHVN